MQRIKSKLYSTMQLSLMIDGDKEVASKQPFASLSKSKFTEILSVWRHTLNGNRYCMAKIETLISSSTLYGDIH